MMDPLRQLRFLVPPFFFFASVIWGAFLDPFFPILTRIASFKDSYSLLIAATGAATIPLGYLIGAITLALFSSLELPYSEETLKIMWHQIGFPMRLGKDMDLQAAATFDRVFLQKEIVEWLVRRFTTFMVAANSVIALVLALVVVHIFTSITITAAWLGTTFFLVFFLSLQGNIAWRQARAMSKLQAEIVLRKRTVSN